MLERAWIAQSVEQRIENPRVGGSIPSPGTKERTTAPPSFSLFYALAEKIRLLTLRLFRLRCVCTRAAINGSRIYINT